MRSVLQTMTVVTSLTSDGRVMASASGVVVRDGKDEVPLILTASCCRPTHRHAIDAVFGSLMTAKVNADRGRE